MVARLTLSKALTISPTTKPPFTLMWAARYQVLARQHLEYLEMLSVGQIVLLIQRVIKGVEFAQIQVIHSGLGSMTMAAEFMLVCWQST